MTKAELIDSISKAAGLSKADTTKALDVLTETIITATAKGDKVHIGGLGAFSISERKEREGRNPRTGEPIVIPADRVPKFKADKSFKDTVNKKKG